jgi:glutamate/tyrosine decarboxylase-like PLP-dependent enzyme
MSQKTLQKRMLDEIKSQTILDNATRYSREYLESAMERNVFPTPQALENLQQFNEEIPDEIGDAGEILGQLHQYGTPATVPMLGGRYYGFVNGSMIPVALAAKLIGAHWDQNTAMQVISPIASKLESVVEDWLVELMGLPPQTKAGFVSGTSMANFCGLAAARYRLLQNQGWDVNEKGLFGAPMIRIVAGREAHSTILKAIALMGFGKENIEWVDTDEEGRIKADQIPDLDDSTLLILQAGNVHSGAFDDFNSITEQAKSARAWIHIDGAFGLWAAATTHMKNLTKGLEYAHSWAVDAHKTLNVPYDSGILLCADPEALVSALHMSGGYIIEGDRDGMYYTPEMSRRARVIELWAAMKYLGRKGIDELVYDLHKRAEQFAAELDKIGGFEILNEVVFNQVVVACESDELTDQVVKKIQELRECWVGGSFWKGRRVIRISVCSWATTSEDISRSVRSFQKALEQTMDLKQ